MATLTIMRLLLILALLLDLLLPIPAVSAAGWIVYGNARFGYSIGVPPGYDLQRRSSNGDGAVFTSENGRQILTVWGGRLLDGDFAAEMASRISADEADGWNVTYRAEAANWVTYSGIRGRRILYARSVSTCSGSGTANFRLEYDQTDLKAMNDPVMRLARSLMGGQAC